MAVTINASTTTGLVQSADTSGIIQLQSNGTTAVTIDTNQRAAFVAGTAALPAITTTGDTNTGIFFPAADTIAFAEGGAEVARFDSSGNLGIGTTSPASRLQIGDATVSTSNGIIFGKYQAASQSNLPAIRQGSFDGAAQDLILGASSGTGTVRVFTGAADSSLDFGTASSAERMRITSSGALCVGTTSATGSVRFIVESDTTTLNPMTVSNTRSTAATDYTILFYRAGNIVGSVQTSLSATSYVTSSDYRLKENIAPMTGALAKVELLKPVTYDWKTGGSSQGFIAHELQAVVPDCVVGDKDEVDADGNIKPQGVDTSFLVATLTAAIQELNAKVDAQAVRIAELEGAR
jgi:hypothetical protein